MFMDRLATVCTSVRFATDSRTLRKNRGMLVMSKPVMILKHHRFSSQTKRNMTSVIPVQERLRRRISSRSIRYGSPQFHTISHDRRAVTLYRSTYPPLGYP